MIGIQRLLVLTGLCLCANSAFAAYSYCVADLGYSAPQQCFPTFAQAEQYLKSNAKSGKLLLDIDSSLFEPRSMTYSTGSVKYYRYIYRDTAPQSLGKTYIVTTPGCPTTPLPAHPWVHGCASEAEAYQAAVTYIDATWWPMTYTFLYRGYFNQFSRPQEPTNENGRTPMIYTTWEASYYGGSGPIVQFWYDERENFLCPDTHVARFSFTPGQACGGGVTGNIYVTNEPIRAAASCSVGNPCHPQTGIKTQLESDLSWEGLDISRAYSSSSELAPGDQFGVGWYLSQDALLYGSDDGSILTRIGGELEVYRRNGQSGRFYYSTNSPGSRIDPVDNANVLELSDGRTFTFGSPQGADLTRLPVTLHVRASSKTFSYVYCGAFEAGCSPGQLKAIRSSSGRTLNFIYGDYLDAAGHAAGNRLQAIAGDGNNLVLYTYDYVGRLAGVAYVGGVDTNKAYSYNEAGSTCVSGSGNTLTPCYVSLTKTLLTSIRDENGKVFAKFKYDNFGRVVSSEHAGGIDKVLLQYNSDLTTTVTDQNNAITTYNSVASRFYKLSSLVVGGKSSSYTYDASNFPDLSTDRAGVVTDTDYDSNGRLLQIVRAKGTPQQQTETTQWHPTLNLPVQTDRVGQRIIRSYNGRGQLLTITKTDLTVTPNASQTSTFTYCEQSGIDLGTCPLLGLLLATDGPRTDVSDISSYEYYQTDNATCATDPANCGHRKGDLWKMSNAIGQVTENQRYDSAGRALSVMDTNGIVTDLEYSSRGWLTARKVRGLDDASETDDAITRLDYDNVGQVLKVTQPDGVYAAFAYDDSHRLTDITDALGNMIHFTLDNAGNRTQEETRDNGGVLRRALSRIYNTLGQLQTLKDANLAATGFTYDANGAVDKATDPLGRVTDSDMDPLGRMSQVVANVNRKAVDQATTKYQYDARNNVTAMTDPKGLTTGYAYNGLDNLTQVSSPDTGVANYSYDSAGNLASHIDSRGVVRMHGYDALNRLINGAVPTLNQSVQIDYDIPSSDCLVGEMYGAGHMSQILDESGSTRFCYDLRGNIVRKVQGLAGGTTLIVGSTYNGAGRLVAMTYPSGAIVNYLRDASGQITRVDAIPSEGAAQVMLVGNIVYLPFGPLTSMTFGNGRSLVKSYDQNYGIDRVNDSTSTGLHEDSTLNAVGNLTALTERISATSTVVRALGYDGLDRLTSQKNGNTVVEAFKYDATGNRTSKTVGALTTSLSYLTTSHHLSSVGSIPRTYDSAGNTATIGTGASAQAFAIDDWGRLRNFKVANVVKSSYRYNGQGERVLKIDAANAANDQLYVYDQAGHLLGEYTANGVRLKEYVWLDDMLIAILSDHDGSTYQFVETDHLGTPRAVVHPVENAILWRWDLTPTAFGEHLPNGNPDGDAFTYTLNLRYPGQYFDAESGLHYNYFRDYDPSTGRYLESDPIGLAGGTSTYAYVGSSPLASKDPFGLETWSGTGYVTFIDASLRIKKKIPVGKRFARAAVMLRSKCRDGKQRVANFVGNVSVETNIPLVKVQGVYLNSIQLDDGQPTADAGYLGGRFNLSISGNGRMSGTMDLGIASGGQVSGWGVGDFEASGNLEMTADSWKVGREERCNCDAGIR